MKFHFLALAMLAITSASGGVYARASDEPSTNAQSSLRGMLLNEDESTSSSSSTSMRGLKRGDGDDDGKDAVSVCVCVLVLLVLV